VYRNAQQGELLITESFFIQFKAQTPELRIREFCAAKA